MTDNEIIKALECCTLSKQICPKNCPLANDRGCMVKVKEAALDLINRQEADLNNIGIALEVTRDNLGDRLRELQQAEGKIDELEAEIERLRPFGTQVEVSKKKEKEIKSEAIKEYIELLKAEFLKDYKGNDDFAYFVFGYIDNLVREMVGE